MEKKRYFDPLVEIMPINTAEMMVTETMSDGTPASPPGVSGRRSGKEPAF